MMFRKFTDRLARIRNQIMWHSYWKEMHEHFIQLCNLVEHANSLLSPLLALIVFADFFFLCERLFRLLAYNVRNLIRQLELTLRFFRTDQDYLERLRIMFLGAFFLVRSFVLFHYCSNVNRDSQEPLRILREAPMENWTLDVRLWFQKILLKFSFNFSFRDLLIWWKTEIEDSVEWVFSSSAKAWSCQ